MKERIRTVKSIIVLALAIVIFCAGCTSNPQSSFSEFQKSVLNKNYRKAWKYISFASAERLSYRDVRNADGFEDYMEHLMNSPSAKEQFRSAHVISTKMSGKVAFVEIEFSGSDGKPMKETIAMIKEGVLWKLAF